ncbi:phosphodiesterase [Celerinatantimonas yamalensis]|uniref:Phosphodiesterase n=1 Tax=Celerinatantimonas yamalensis TaxID=559956 RepID=A0ABW9GB86_9GAMM
MRIAQLSDMHFVSAGERLYGSVDVNAQNADIIHQLNQLHEPVDAVVITGDISNDGISAQYQAAAKILSYIRCPLYVINGNHDERAAFIDAFAPLCPPLQQAGEMRYAVEYPFHRLLFVDSTVLGQTYGHLSEASLDWIEVQLKSCDKPVVVFMHHPPISMNSAHMDPICCLNGDTLLTFAQRYSHFSGIYCGHNHCFSITSYQQLIIAAAPATSVQIPVYQNDSTPYYQFGQASCLIHTVTDNGRWVSYQHHFSGLQGMRRFPWVNERVVQ